MRSIAEVFNDRTRFKFTSKPVEETVLKKIYDLMKLGPTYANSSPLRILFVQTQDMKEHLYKCLSPTSINKSNKASVHALFAYDMKFYDLLPRLFPHDLSYKEYLSESEQLMHDTALRNSSMQAAYFMIIARSFGLACGPMSEFNNDAVNELFFQNSNYRINFICNLGYGDGETVCPKLERLDYEETCLLI